LLELKVPSAQVFVLQQRRMRFAAAVAEACAQLREYSMFFDEEANRQKVQKQYGLLAFKPRMFVIIGRRGDVSPIDVRKMETDLPNIRVRTYDDVVDRIKAKVDAMRHGGRKFNGIAIPWPPNKLDASGGSVFLNLLGPSRHVGIE
jgi:hypothetical protein